jgi:hypothetical protein
MSLLRTPSRIPLALVLPVALCVALASAAIAQDPQTASSTKAAPPAQAMQGTAATPEGTTLSVANSILPIEVLVESPAMATGDLQVICLFQSLPQNKLAGSLVVLDQHLNGLLSTMRSAQLFHGDLGETLVIEPKPGAIKARRLLVVGLGDRATFTPQREELVGEIVYEESQHLGADDPNFAPTILDGGLTGFNTGEVAKEFLRGFLRGRAIATELHISGAGHAPTITKLTFLAGATHATDTRDGLASVLNDPAITKAP